jgi:hypothetical protein
MPDTCPARLIFLDSIIIILGYVTAALKVEN